MTNVPIIKFMFRSEWKTLPDALHMGPVYSSEEFDSANDVTTFLSGVPAGLVIVSLQDKNDLVQLATMMKLVKKVASSTTLKVMVVNFSGNRQFEKAVDKLGILDLVDGKIQTKALRYKIDFMMKSINAQIKKTTNAATSTVKALENTKNQEKKAAENIPVWASPLDCEDDIWILRTEVDCKKIISRWLIKLVGPSPYVAGWVESGTPGLWKFDFKSNKDSFIAGKGTWYFKGDQKPDFIWNENIWTFTGESFELYYKQENQTLSRLNLKDKILTITKTSEFAKMREKIILESFDKDLVFKKELQANIENENFDGEKEKLQNLEGKGKTDSITQGPLSGKSKTDALAHDPLSGKSKTDSLNQGPLSGKMQPSGSKKDDPLAMDLEAGENSSFNDPLTQKTKTTKGSTFWKGKNEYEKEGKAEADDLLSAASEGVKSGSELSLEANNSHQKYYKNHNEAEKFEAKDIGHAIKKDGVSDNLKGKTDPSKATPNGAADLNGKSSTDKLKAHLTSPDSAKDKSGQGEAHKPESANDKSGQAQKPEKDLSGKTSTDKLQGHLTSPDGKKQHATKELSGDKTLGHAAAEKEAKERTAKEAAPKTEIEKKTEQLAALRAKKEKIEKEHEEKEAIAKRKESASLQVSKPIADGETLDIEKDKARSKELPDKEKSSATRLESENKSGKILNFKEKEAESNFEATNIWSRDLEDSIQTAKVTSYLIQDPTRVSCILDDHFDQSIIFTTNESGISKSKKVTLNLNFKYLNKSTDLKFDGNITQMESDEEGTQYITVEISKENVSAFNAFMKLYNMRQKNIDFYLKQVKGN